jgi:hypothetical protein
MDTDPRPRYNPEAHARITAAIRGDHRTPAEWARRLGLKPSTLNHRLTGRTPWTLDETMAIAFRLGTTVDDLVYGRWTPGPRRTSRGITRPHGRHEGN